MKELSTEEKAKTYDEAIERARKIHNETEFDYKRDMMEEIFPELKESDDERIRKAIISFLKRRMQVDSSIPAAIGSWIAWLEKQGKHAKFCGSIQIGDKVTRNEDGVLVNLSQLNRVAKKQGEQKPADKVKPKFKVGDVVANKKSKDTVKIVQILYDSYCYSGWNGAATVHSDFRISEQDDWELVEKEPIENSCKISEDDNVESEESTEYNKGFECGKQRVLKYPEDFGLYKKTITAWSEEDEKILELLKALIEDAKGDSTSYSTMFREMKELNNWLKSLKDRVQPQPKQEWSEEDDYNLQCMIAKVTSDIQKGNVGRNQELIDWLKSLRLQSHWKPSDEQMEALDRAQAELCSTKYNKPICDLIDSLNKLREK